MKLSHLNQVFVHQVFEAAELFGFETRNKYAVVDEHRRPLAFAAEQRKSFFGFLLRQYLGHWFKFDIVFYNADRKPILTAHHPFRWFFTRIELKDNEQRFIGAIEKRFSFFSKRFDILNSNQAVVMEVSSPIWKLWTFEFTHLQQRLALVQKKWSGLLAESFTDKDNFRVEFSDRGLGEDERQLVVVAAVFIDLLYFENKE